MNKRLLKTLSVVAIALSTASFAAIGTTLATFEASRYISEISVSTKRVIYLSCEKCGAWEDSGAKFGAWIWDATPGSELPDGFCNDAFMEYCGNHIYRCTVPAGYTHITFVRDRYDAPAPTFSSPYRYAQTSNQTIPADCDCFMLHTSADNVNNWGGAWDVNYEFEGGHHDHVSYQYSYSEGSS